MQAECALTFGAGLQPCAFQQGLQPCAFQQGLQPCAFQQGLQALFGLVSAFQALALNAAGGGGAEGNQHAGFTAELVQGVFQ